MKTEAIELADTIDNSEETTGFERRMASVMRAQAAEIERLTTCLKKANDQGEHFEREWYLRGDAIERKDALLREALEALKYHTAQTRPIERTFDVIDKIKTELGESSNAEITGLSG